MRAAVLAFTAAALLACGDAAPTALENADYSASDLPQDPCSSLATCCPHAARRDVSSCRELVREGDTAACRRGIADMCGWCIGPGGMCPTAHSD